ncbi:MAG: ATP-binding protein [Bacteroidales bacterium]|nr:ATP-binding protein [Bacteroidales bacterium]
MSFFALYIFNSYMAGEMYKHAEKDIHTGISLMQGQIIHTVSQFGGKALHPLLDNFKRDSHFQNIYVFNSNDSLVYQSDTTSAHFGEPAFIKTADLNEDVSIESFTSRSDPNLRAYIRFQNAPSCQQCHNSSKKYLGMLVFDIPLGDTTENISTMRNFSILYSVLIVFIILVSAFLVHYRFVKKSLYKFHRSIDIINQGNLDERLSIPDSKELGKLGKSFNDMVDTFQKTQKELQIYNQKELENKYKMATIGEMTARLAHEIRNPITGIANAAEILVEHVPEDENKPVLEEIRRQAERVNNAISNMLRFSKSTNITLEKNDINEIIRNLVFFVKNQTHHKKVEFKKELQENIPLFRFDQEKIENVLLNLVLNAIQSISEAGTVTFKTAFDTGKKQVIITVEDTGAGIPGPILKDIFNPFFTTRTEGTGLGLAIARENVEKHKGKIWAESEESKGTKFFITLPIDNKST